MISFFIGLRYTLYRRGSRLVSFISTVAMLGIILSVMLLVTVLSVMNGFDKELRERILGIMPHITLHQNLPMTQWQNTANQLLQHPQVNQVSPFIELNAMLYKGDKTQWAMIYGLNDEINTKTTVPNTIHDFLPSGLLGKLNQSPNQLAIGVHLAKKLGLSQGDYVTVIVPTVDHSQSRKNAPRIRQMKLITVFETKTGLDDSLILMGLASAASLSLKPNQTSGLHIKIDDLFQSRLVAQTLVNTYLLNTLHAYFTDWKSRYGNMYYSIQMSKKLVAILLFLIVAIAAFNVIATLVMVVVDKQKDIAILKTLGLSRQNILGIFIVQGSLISLIGTSVGVLLGVLLSVSIDNIAAWFSQWSGHNLIKADIYPVSFLPSSVTIEAVITVALLSLLMSFLATLYPALKASWVQPAQVLRHD